MIPNCTVSDRDVCVLPERLSDDYCDKLGSLIRLNELELLRYILNGSLDLSILKSPCDETVVADSDVEETATSVTAAVSLGTRVAGNVPHELSINDADHKSENDFVMSSRRSGNISTIRGKIDESESGNVDIIYSQDLIVRDKNTPGTVPTANNKSINFKRFRKTNIQSGNSFINLIPFSKDPHNNSDSVAPGTLLGILGHGK